MCGQRPVANWKLAYQCGYGPTTEEGPSYPFTTAEGPGFFPNFFVSLLLSPFLFFWFFFLFSSSSSNFVLNLFHELQLCPEFLLLHWGAGGSLAQTSFNSFSAPCCLHRPPLLFLLLHPATATAVSLPLCHRLCPKLHPLHWGANLWYKKVKKNVQELF